jgi:hypothetical protein
VVKAPHKTLYSVPAAGAVPALGIHAVWKMPISEYCHARTDHDAGRGGYPPEANRHFPCRRGAARLSRSFDCSQEARRPEPLETTQESEEPGRFVLKIAHSSTPCCYTTDSVHVQWVSLKLAADLAIYLGRLGLQAKRIWVHGNSCSLFCLIC